MLLWKMGKSYCKVIKLNEHAVEHGELTYYYRNPFLAVVGFFSS